MVILRFILNVIGVFVAALVGNWVGERWRAVDTGEEGHELAIIHTGEEGEYTIAVNPLLTNFLPAVIVGLLGKQAGWALAFVIGVMTARFMGDQYEDQFDELISGFLPQTELEKTPERDMSIIE